MIYTAEKTLGDFGDKLSEDEKNSIKSAADELKEAVKGTDTEAIKAKQENLQKAVYAVSEKIYKDAAAAQGAAEGNPAGGAEADPNVYEADFKDADDNN